MKLHSLGRIFSLVAMLALVFALTFALAINANAATSAEEIDITVLEAGIDDLGDTNITVACGKVRLVWDEVPGANAYRIYKDGQHVATSNIPSFVTTLPVNDFGEDTVKVSFKIVAAATAGGTAICDGTVTIAPRHAWDNGTVTTDPTCTENGVKTYICACDSTHVYTTGDEAEVEMLGHTYTNYVSNGDATCLEDGTKTAFCDNGCGTTDTLPDTGSALGHSYTNYLSNGDATCLTDGTKTALCDNGCGTTDTLTDTDSKLGHTYVTYVSNGDATCLTDGTETATCIRCTETDTQTDVNSKLGHNFQNYVYNNDATCILDGTETGTCTRCPETHTKTAYNTYLDHEFVNYVSNNDATCTLDGTETATCTRCTETDTQTDVGSKLNHNYTSVVTPSTCTAAGYTTYTCTRCQDSYVDDYTAVLGHDFKNYVSNNNATCTANGTETGTCTRCPEKDTKTEANSALGHDWADATCTTPKTCKRTGCGATDGASLGHNYGAVVTAPTCTAGGYTTHTCSRCSDTYTDTPVAALGHTNGSPVKENVVPSTCTEYGSYDFATYCTVCGAETLRSSATSSPNGHDFADATCTKAKTCKNCPATEGEALGHLNDTPIAAVAATCTKTGLTDGIKCSRCNTVTTAQNATPMIPHKNDVTLAAVAPTCEETGLTAGVKCSACGTITTAQNTVEALGHDYKREENPDKVFLYEYCDRCDAKNKKGLPKFQFTKTLQKIAIVAGCALVIILSIKALRRPATTTPWWKRRKYK